MRKLFKILVPTIVLLAIAYLAIFSANFRKIERWNYKSGDKVTIDKGFEVTYRIIFELSSAQEIEIVSNGTSYSHSDLKQNGVKVLQDDGVSIMFDSKSKIDGELLVRHERGLDFILMKMSPSSALYKLYGRFTE